ncbi:hypothetical protein EGR_04333 [Echinococcus granulosus]|uniref:Secreted protein n=1 Tax=Echinococcus granulosus TaxID=6210 RepID=W6UQW9_ECHGR|nr:hypothetical protein EGR_04333 [Echinococcus granulosus]EUB60707.1 hypothetical protein EGR_04333 [Echinococcus granulosus]
MHQPIWTLGHGLWIATTATASPPANLLAQPAYTPINARAQCKGNAPPTARHATPRQGTALPLATAIGHSDSLQADARTDVATGKPMATICVQDVDVQSSLRFTLIHTVGCTLHRRTRQTANRTAYKEQQS